MFYQNFRSAISDRKVIIYKEHSALAESQIFSIYQKGCHYCNVHSVLVFVCQANVAVIH